MRAKKPTVYDGTLIYERKRGDPPDRIDNSRTLAGWITDKLFGKLSDLHMDKEYFVVTTLDARNQVKHAEIVAIGSLTACIIHPREVFRPAVLRGAAAVVLAHNHPSGDPTPSPEDVQLTERLTEAGRILGIRCLDHVVIATDGFVSLMDRS